MAVNPLDRNQPCVDQSGKPLQNLLIIIEQLRKLEILSGTGSPEGVVSASRKRLYMNDVNGDLYVKRVDSVGGDASLGWVLV